jgi:citrate lyase subunit beta/citryl-CoA lyase
MIRVFRSLLFVPGTRPDRFAKAMVSGADGVVFDLEDSVEPASKAAGRNAIGQFLSTPIQSSVLRFVRVNAFGSPWFEDDLKFIGQKSMFDGVILPKAETALQVEEVGRRITGNAVVPLIETARGILNALAIAEADKSTFALVFGAEDLTAQLGVPRTVEGNELLVPRSTIALAAAAAGTYAIDGVFTDIRDSDTLRQDCLYARALGFHGKIAIHPSQVSIINEIFSPSPADIEQAWRIVGAYEEALARGEGVVRVYDKMVDGAVYRRARRVLALTDALRNNQPIRTRM